MAESAIPAYEEPTESAWLALGALLFASTIMITVGGFQLFMGLAAIVGGAFYVIPPDYPYQLDPGTWGWIHTTLGVLLVAVGSFLLVGKLWARIVAIALAMISAWVNFLDVPYYPVWSILCIALNIVVIWAVATHGKELQEAAE
jgi:hypothetical protein